MGVILQNLVGFAELDILKVLPIDLQDLQEEEERNIWGVFYQNVYNTNFISYQK